MKIALAGIGEIAVQQHVPTIAASPDWELVATFSLAGQIAGIPNFSNFTDMLVEHDEIRVVSLCLPPKPRWQYAFEALEYNRHVMLEKPPGATLSECLILESLARDKNLSLFGAWHSRQADRVVEARAWLRSKKIRRIAIIWREDVHRWHAGQEWIWQTGGFGVLDPGINALSILTEILPHPLHVVSSTLYIPSNKQTPIAADLVFHYEGDVQATAVMDWRETGEQHWRIEIDTDEGNMQLNNGGSELIINGVKLDNSDEYEHLSGDAATNTLGNEYRKLYMRMTELVRLRHIDMDLTPLSLVADTFMLADIVTVEPFYDEV